MNASEKWYHAGQLIFDGNKNMLDSLKDMKRKRLTYINKQFLESLSVKVSGLTWGSFKEHGVNVLKICELESVDLSGKENTKLSDLYEQDRNKIARALPSGGWELFATDQTETYKNKFKRYEITNLKNCFQQSDFKPTEDLYQLIIQSKPDFTMGQFYTFCESLDYSDVLKQIKTFCMDQGYGR